MSGFLKRRLRTGLLVFLGLLVVASLLTYPPETGNGGELLSGARIDAPILSTLKRACADCHSYETRYPWYSYVAPISWLIQSDVKRGRQRLNLSEWGEYSDLGRQRYLSEIANQVKDGEMPLRLYTLVHRDARLSNAQVDAIFKWTQAEQYRLIAERTSRQP